jgi:predicted 3-demethylubiquinone-9 3-methyltransferase (glyoxalase superfamily)
VFTGEEKVGTKRINYGRTSDPNVILSLTRALENSYVLAATEKGYTIGVNNPDSEKKIEWMEEKYGVIYELTLDERKIALNAANATAQIIMK